MKRKLIAALVICLLAQPIQGVFADETEQSGQQTPVETLSPEPTQNTETLAPEATEAQSTPQPTELPKPEGTPNGELQPNQEGEQETVCPLKTAAQRNQIPESAEAWMRLSEAYAYGTLEEVIAYAQANDTIALHTEKVMRLKEAPVQKLSTLKLMLDEDVFSGSDWEIVYYRENPDDTESPVRVDADTFKDAKESDTMELFVRVEAVNVNPEETEKPEITIAVDVDDYRVGAWSNVLPTFTLSGKPEDGDYSYAVVVYDERIALMSENVYTAQTEGVYTVRFAILNPQGDIVSASERYTLMLDATAPEVSANVDYETSYTLRLSASDAISGVSEISVDGGNTWEPLEDGTEWVYTASSKTTIASGMLCVRDVAGNIWTNGEDYVLTKVSSGYSGGGGDGGDGTKKPDHAAGDREEKPDYDTVELVFPDEPMTVLTMGETELPLTLELSDSGDFEKPADYAAKFNAELRVWPKPVEYDEDGNIVEAQEDPQPDTLVLSAVEEENMGNRFEYRWKVNGEVFRLLANSEIRYLVLNVHDNYAVFPTAGFTGGTQYTALRMSGFSVKSFDYTVAMSVNLDPDHIPSISKTDLCENCDIAIQVEADGAKYVMSAEQKGEMYFYDVTLGTAEMLEVPFGEYGVQTKEETNA